MLKKIISFSRKVIKGEPLVKIKYTKEEWDQQFEKGNWDFLLSSPQNNVAQVAYLIKSIEKSQGHIDVLDVGCGNGSLVREISGLDLDYVGIDISAKALEKAAKEFPQGTYIQGTMDNKIQLGKKFDIIVFCEVLLYGDYEKILNFYRDYLKEDGYIIVSLYDVWRTRLIWKVIKRQLEVKQFIYINNITKGVGWNVCLGKFK